MLPLRGAGAPVFPDTDWTPVALYLVAMVGFVAAGLGVLARGRRTRRMRALAEATPSGERIPDDPLDTAEVRQYLTFMKTRVSSKGQIVLPAEFRQLDRIEPGEEFDVERLDRGDYRLVRRTTRPNDGVIDWLLACPGKGFFVPVDSESTDTL